MTINRYYDPPDKEPSKQLNPEENINTQKQIINPSTNNKIIQNDKTIDQSNKQRIINILTQEIIDITTSFFKPLFQKLRPESFQFNKIILSTLLCVGCIIPFIPFIPKNVAHFVTSKIPVYPQITTGLNIYSSSPQKFSRRFISEEKKKPSNKFKFEDQEDNEPSTTLSKEDRQFIANALHPVLKEYKDSFLTKDTIEIGIETRIGVEVTPSFFNPQRARRLSNESDTSNSTQEGSSSDIIPFPPNRINEFDAIVSQNHPNNPIFSSNLPMKPVAFVGIYIRKPLFRK